MKNVTPIEEAPVRDIKPIPQHMVRIAESKRIIHCIDLPASTQLEDLLVPDFWVNAASSLHRHDLIEVVPYDESWWALLIVIQVGPEFAQLHLLQKYDLPTRPKTVDDLPLGHSTFYLGATRGWAALRDSTILKCYFSNKDDAIAWIIDTARG